MYAVIKAGGKQHRVKPGDVIEVELMHAKDDSVSFHPLLVVDDDNKTHVGKEIAKAVVTGKLVGEQKGEKVKVFKYRNKTGYARHQGHRQMHTLVEIGEIRLPGQPAAKKAAEKPAESDGEAKPKSSAKSAASKSTAMKTESATTETAKSAAAEEEEDTAAEAAPAETSPAEGDEGAPGANAEPDAGEGGETEAEAEAEAGEERLVP